MGEAVNLRGRKDCSKPQKRISHARINDSWRCIPYHSKKIHSLGMNILTLKHADSMLPAFSYAAQSLSAQTPPYIHRGLSSLRWRTLTVLFVLCRLTWKYVLHSEKGPIRRRDRPEANVTVKLPAFWADVCQLRAWEVLHSFGSDDKSLCNGEADC